jgi:cation diffusion facilitator family transporter
VARWAWYSIGINILLTGINLGIAVASGSLAVRAEMVHNLVDLLTAIAVLVGLKLSMRKTEEFPYGLYKLENVIAVGLALMTFLTAYEIARDALLTTAKVATVDPWMVGAIVAAAAIPLFFSHFELQAGRAANSPALIADAKEYRAHVFTTGVVLASFAGSWLDVSLDRAAALVIVVAISRTGWDLLVSGMRPLLDASLGPDTLLEIRRIIEAEPTVVEIEELTGRSAGRYRFVETRVRLRVETLERAEVVTQRVEVAIRRAVPFVERVLVHAEPVERRHWCYGVPLVETGGAVSDHFGEAPYLALVRLRVLDGAVEEKQIRANPFLAEERAKGIRVAEWLVANGVDVVLLRKGLGGKGPVYVFGDAGVETRLTQCKTLDEVIDEQRELLAVPKRER